MNRITLCTAALFAQLAALSAPIAVDWQPMSEMPFAAARSFSGFCQMDPSLSLEVANSSSQLMVLARR